MTMPDDDLARIAEQEKVLSFDSFDLATAWQLGKLLQELGSERGLGIAIDINLHSMPVFYVALPGVTPDNVQWCAASAIWCCAISAAAMPSAST